MVVVSLRVLANRTVRAADRAVAERARVLDSVVPWSVWERADAAADRALSVEHYFFVLFGGCA